MTGSPQHFYDQLAADYHLIFTDWSESITRQAAALDRLIRAHQGAPPLRLLDCSCGIGTQAIGLAERGYTVHATDLSPQAVARAAAEATARGVTLTTGVADFRTLDEQVSGSFDIVLSCDNALPHLLTDDDLQQAARGMYARLEAGGLLVIGIRDYDALALERPYATPTFATGSHPNRRVVFQLWDWSEDGRTYDLTLFIVQQAGSAWATQTYSTTYRALQRSELSAILTGAGFTDVRWHMPQDTGYSQPVVTARRPEI